MRVHVSAALPKLGLYTQHSNCTRPRAPQLDLPSLSAKLRDTISILRVNRHHHCLRLGVVVERQLSLLSALAARLAAAEGCRRVEVVVAIDPDDARLKISCSRQSGADIPGADAG